MRRARERCTRSRVVRDSADNHPNPAGAGRVARYTDRAAPAHGVVRNELMGYTALESVVPFDAHRWEASTSIPEEGKQSGVCRPQHPAERIIGVGRPRLVSLGRFRLPGMTSRTSTQSVAVRNSASSA